MKKWMKKILVLAVTGVMLAGSVFTALADTPSPESAYLSLGADLSESEKGTVLDLLGVDAGHLDDYQVLEVTNEEEHRYLDNYINQDQIGTAALSSVLVEKAESGSGIQVQTYNISYCTEGMYANALTTAGVTDANVVVAGPYEISGTAALIGAAKAFSEISGTDLDEKALDGALDEMITTGELEQALDAAPEKVESLIAELKEKAASGDLDLGDKESVLNTIQEAAGKYELRLSDDQMQKISELLEKISHLDLSIDSLSQQVQKLGNQLQDMGITTEKAKSLFQRFLDWLRTLFS